MRARPTLLCLVCLVSSNLAVGLPPASPAVLAGPIAADEFEDLSREYAGAHASWKQEKEAADSAKERSRLRGVAPARTFYPRFRALAEAGEGRALLWMAREAKAALKKSKVARAAKRECLETLVRDYSSASWAPQIVELLDGEMGKSGEQPARDWLLRLHHSSESSTCSEAALAVLYWRLALGDDSEMQAGHDLLRDYQAAHPSFSLVGGSTDSKSRRAFLEEASTRHYISLPLADSGLELERVVAAAPLQPVANIAHNGRIFIGSECLFIPLEQDRAKESLVSLRYRARAIAAASKRAQGSGVAGNGPNVASMRLTIRADVHSPWRSTQKLMEAASSKEVSIGLFDLAVRSVAVLDSEQGFNPTSKSLEYERRIPIYLPTHADLQASDAAPREVIEIIIRVAEPGRRVLSSDPTQAYPAGSLEHFDVLDRRIEYSIGPRKYVDFESMGQSLTKIIGSDDRPVLIDTHGNVFFGEVCAVAAFAFGEGVKDLRFLASAD